MHGRERLREAALGRAANVRDDLIDKTVAREGRIRVRWDLHGARCYPVSTEAGAPVRNGAAFRRG